MPYSMFETALTSFGNANINWASNTVKLALLSYLSTDAGLLAITGATNATPIVLTTAAHGLSEGDLISVSGVGGNLSANGIWRVGAGGTSTTIPLADPGDIPTAVVGSGNYTSGGIMVSLGTTGEFYEDFNNCLVSTAVTLAGKTSSQGAFDATDPTFPTASGPDVNAMLLYQDTGNIATSRNIAFNDGNMIVIAAGQAAPGATDLYVQPLTANIASGVTLAFSDGSIAVTTDTSTLGSTLVIVSALAATVNSGARASSPIDGSGFPLVLDGSDVNVSVILNYFFKL